MSKKLERKKKMIQLMKELMLTEISKKTEVPSAISDYFLKEYGLADKSTSLNVSDDIIDFVEKLENLIKEKGAAKKTLVNGPRINSDVDPKQNFMKACETNRTKESEYIKAASRLTSLLNEIVEARVTNSHRVKEMASMKLGEWEILEKRLDFIKLQSLLKLYGDKNVFEAHLQLRDLLMKKSEALKYEYNDLVERNCKYTELKDNKMYSSLLYKYKMLLKVEKKLECMMQK